MARGDFPAAANLLDRASRVLDEGELDRSRLLVSAGEAYLEIGEFTTADDLLGRASSEAEIHRGWPIGDYGRSRTIAASSTQRSLDIDR